MVDVLTEIEIACPQREVAEYAADPEKAPEWYVNIKSAEFVSGANKPLSIGSQIAFKAQFLGRQLEYVYEIVEFVPLKKLVMRTADGPFPMETTYTWETVEEGKTRMTLRNRGVPSGFSKLLTPFMKMAMGRANRNDLRRLKYILEKAL